MSESGGSHPQSSTRWMVWYDDGEPIAVLADSRAKAMEVGKRARDERVSAAVAEDEGAADDLSGLSDQDLSTADDPRRFIREVLY